MPDFYERTDDPTLVNTTTDGDQTAPVIAVFGDGSHVVVWTDTSGGDPAAPDIKAQLFGSDGEKIGGEFSVATATAGAQASPSVAALADGRFVVTWIDESGEGGDGSGFGIKAQIFDAAGATIGGEFLVNSFTESTQSQPVVAGLADGGFVISWADASGEGGDDSGASIKAQLYDAAGMRIGGEFLVNTTTDLDPSEPAIVALSTGGFSIAWEGRDPSYGTPAIFVQTFDAAGAAIGGEQRVNAGTYFFQNSPSIAAIESGFVVVWEGRGGNWEEDIVKAQLFDLAGQKSGGELKLTVPAETSVTEPSVQGLSDGGFIVTWNRWAASGDSKDIYTQAFDHQGRPVGDLLLVHADADGNQDSSQVAELPSGEIAIVYADNSDTVGDASGYAVRLQRFSTTDTLDGTLEDDVLNGGPGDNEINGGEGDDSLSGGAGADLLDGGNGIDTARYEWSEAGVDVDLARAGPQLGGDAEGDVLTSIENLTGSGHADTLRGDDAGNRLSGGEGDDLLDGAGGADRLEGGRGNDNFVVDDSGDIIVEAAGEGSDTVRSWVDFVLPDHVEQVVLTGSAAINGTGNSGANTIVGNGAANRLDGRGGADTMRGGGGNDVYIVDNISDRVTELSGQGVDTVRSSVSHTLANHIENLALTDAGFIDGTGNGLANVISGNAKANKLDGGAGADTLRGGKGHDTYIVDNGGDTVIEAAGEGTDTIRTYVSYTLPEEVEALALGGAGVTDATGNALDNRLYGNAKANV
ncbi:calcium-binding protein, partial [Sphingosinicella terrae]|uniref:calcium-binding protein n=1 Tax=Sphingosinicella terrae TaxID=2172047 RepID=UPI0013B435A8